MMLGNMRSSACASDLYRAIYSEAFKNATITAPVSFFEARSEGGGFF
jgi:hypothetical protein